MVLAFTEEQKKEIEARKMTVIEFKRILHNMKNAVNNIVEVLKDIADNIKKIWNVFKEKIIEIVDDIRMVFEAIKDRYHYPTSHRYKIVKLFSKCIGTPISFGWSITFKIKRWLARRYC